MNWSYGILSGIVELFARFLAYCFPSKETLDAEAVDREWDTSDVDDLP